MLQSPALQAHQMQGHRMLTGQPWQVQGLKVCLTQLHQVRPAQPEEMSQKSTTGTTKSRYSRSGTRSPGHASSRIAPLLHQKRQMELFDMPACKVTGEGRWRGHAGAGPQRSCTWRVQHTATCHSMEIFTTAPVQQRDSPCAGPSGAAASPTDPFGALGDFAGEGAAGVAGGLRQTSLHMLL